MASAASPLHAGVSCALEAGAGLTDEWEAREARDAALGGSRGFERDGTVGKGETMKLGIATTRAVFGPSEGSGVRDWWWERPEGAGHKGEMTAKGPSLRPGVGEEREMVCV